MIKPNKMELANIGRWIIDGDTGMSSLALCSFYLTSANNGECASYLHTPSDPSDFRRCIEFLEKCLFAENRILLINDIGEMTKGWRKIREHWVQLTAVYEKEKTQPSAPELYNLMKQIGL